MKRRLYILFLFLVQLFILGHDFIPHHHHEETYHEHDSSDSHSNDLGHFFSHFVHSSGYFIQEWDKTSTDISQKEVISLPAVLSTPCIQKANFKYLKSRVSPYRFLFYNKRCYHRILQLRGPPRSNFLA